MRRRENLAFLHHSGSETEPSRLIGVVAKENEKEVVEEFFQLFKTPWEFFQESDRYQVVIASGEEIPETVATLTLIFGNRHLPGDSKRGAKSSAENKARLIRFKQLPIPIYGDLLAFETIDGSDFHIQETGEAVAHRIENEKRIIIRIGYDLFYEVNFLLTEGQPATFAPIPTLDHHIDVLRQLMINSKVPVIEIPPTPFGYDFIACLTHDVDFVGIRRHFLDRTFFGFLYRASIGSLLAALKGRIPTKRLFRSWYAVLLLPLVFSRLAKDFWEGFEDYLRIENELSSTFFFIPAKNTAGKIGGGTAPETRAVRYEIGEISRHIDRLIDKGREIGLHGIDAWIDSESGRREKEAVSRVSKEKNIGVRMHWLYFDPRTPSQLSEASFSYDSTMGYNEAVGFRSGTVQSHRLPNSDVHELPLNIMDTALFYPDRMNLTEREAWGEVQRIVKSFQHSGGVMTINWHLRSLAPERQWSDFYTRLLSDLKKRRVWFATGAQAVRWFQKRRSVSFENVDAADTVSVKRTDVKNAASPGLTLRVHKPNEGCEDIRIPDRQAEITIRS